MNILFGATAGLSVIFFSYIVIYILIRMIMFFILGYEEPEIYKNFKDRNLSDDESKVVASILCPLIGEIFFIAIFTYKIASLFIGSFLNLGVKYADYVKKTQDLKKYQEEVKGATKLLSYYGFSENDVKDLILDNNSEKKIKELHEKIKIIKEELNGLTVE